MEVILSDYHFRLGDNLIAPNLTSSLVESYGIAAAVCYDKNGFHPEIEHEITGDIQGTITLDWDKLTSIDNNTYNDLQEATEWGATVIAFLLIKQYTNYRVISRSKKGTGYDYFLGSGTGNLFQDMAKLEVSGILKVTKKNSIEQRKREKMKQAEKYDKELTVFVVVTGFSSKESGVCYVRR
jgi:hypothetical protein